MSIHAETIQSNTWCQYMLTLQIDTWCQYMLRQYRVIHDVNTCWDTTDRYIMSIHAETLQIDNHVNISWDTTDWIDTSYQYMLRHYRSIHHVNTYGILQIDTSFQYIRDTTDRYIMSIHAETLQINTCCQNMLRYYCT